MRIRAGIGVAAAAVLAAGGVAAMIPVANAATTSSPTSKSPTIRACHARPVAGSATCLAIAVAGPGGHALRSSRPLATGFTPTDIEHAYNLSGLKSGGRTVAIIDAYGYPTLESDLALYRSTYDLPACTTKNGCLTIMNQNGGSKTPTVNSGWDVEQALDVDAVSAACPDCHILVVEAKNASLYNLGAAVNRASIQKGVAAISNSYTGRKDRHKNTAYNHRGIAITAATGDSGFQGGAYPADDTHVVAVGGTSVTKSGNTYTESAWSGAGSGCALYTKVPHWQQGIDTTCATKADSDVSAAADPNLGGLNIALNGQFEQVGGTSEATPIIAAVFALSGNTHRYPAVNLYEHPQFLNDVTTGSNGACGSPLCDAGKGWDGPTGMGTPNGDKAF
jgi:subtilase family serine protease